MWVRQFARQQHRSVRTGQRECAEHRPGNDDALGSSDAPRLCWNTRPVIAFVSAGAGFLLSVLWFDLMFDVQVVGHHGAVVDEGPLASIAGYYRRVTTAARPMNRLIAIVMLATLVAIVAEIVNGDVPRWAAWSSLALAAAPILLAAGHTVPSAARLGSRRDPVDYQSSLARTILREHALCAVAISALLALQLAAA